MDRVKKIRCYLEDAFSPSSLEISDDSHLHIGHAGAKGGAGHFTVKIISKSFIDKNAIQRHQMVYASLANMMNTEIHALSIKAITPDESDAVTE